MRQWVLRTAIPSCNAPLSPQNLESTCNLQIYVFLMWLKRVTYPPSRFQRRLWHLACWAVETRLLVACAFFVQAKWVVVPASVSWTAGRRRRTFYDLYTLFWNFTLLFSVPLSSLGSCARCAAHLPQAVKDLRGEGDGDWSETVFIRQLSTDDS